MDLLEKFEKYFSVIFKTLISKNLEFETQVVLQGIAVDFFVPEQRLAIIITEKEHDHGEAYYAEMMEMEHLRSCGFKILQLPLTEFNGELPKILTSLR